MKISSAKFINSVAKANKVILDEKNQIAFVGRSNVGKSSLLNYLVGNNKLAKTSSLPGRTRLINYFLINDSIYFVDLPGYGFAKASKTESEEWQSLIEPYLTRNSKLKCVCVLLDVRHMPSEQDIQMIKFLVYYNISFLLIATKCDKLSKTQIKPQILKISNFLGVGKDNIYPVSAVKDLGKVELLNKLEQFL